MTTRVVIAAEHALRRDGLRMLLQAAGDLEVVGQATTPGRALDVATRTLPDVVLVDVRVPSDAWLDLCVQIQSADPLARCVLVMSAEDRRATARALRVVAACVLRDAHGADVIREVREAAAMPMALAAGGNGAGAYRS